MPGSSWRESAGQVLGSSGAAGRRERSGHPGWRRQRVGGLTGTERDADFLRQTLLREVSNFAMSHTAEAAE